MKREDNSIYMMGVIHYNETGIWFRNDFYLKKGGNCDDNHEL